jgi:O-antigen ligase
MVGLVVALITCLGIAALLWIDRGEVSVSKETWIPTAWLLIACSRPITNWVTLSAPQPGYDSYVEGSPVDRNVLTLLLGLALFVLYKRSRKVASIIRVNTPLLLFLGFCALSALWSDYPSVVLKRWVRSLGDTAMVLVIVTDPNWVEALKRILARVAYVLVPLSLLLIRFFPSLGRAYTVAGAPMWTGVATDKNALGMLCMLTGVALFWRGLGVVMDRHAKYRQRQMITIVTLLGMVVYLLFIVDSKTALACFLMASLLIAITVVRMFRRTGFISLVAGSMFAVAYAVLFLGMGSGALETMGRNSSLTGRTEVWNIVMPFVENPWIGAGYENFWIGKRLEKIEILVGAGLNQAHNGYIEIYLNIGLIGLALLAFLMVTGYRNVMRELKTNPEMGRLKLAFFFMCLVYNFTEASFKMGSPVWIMFLWAAMGYPKVRPKSAPSPTYVPEVAAEWSPAGSH